MADVPSLIGPDDRHAYITYCPTPRMSNEGQDRYTHSDYDKACNVTQMLEQKHLTCCLRGRNFSEEAELKNVKASIDRSNKIIFMISKNYLGNAWFKMDIEYALKKLRGRNQMASFIGIMLDVPERDLPDNIAKLHILKYDDVLRSSDYLYKLVTSDQQPQMSQQLVGEYDIASGLAWPYYYGYLNLILTDMDKRIKASGHWSEDRDRRTMPLKLIIVIPESCYSPPTFAKEDPKIETVGSVTCFVSRAGNPHRDYKNNIHKIIDHDGKDYYFVGEYATPILSLYEMARGNLCGGLTESDMFHHLSLFYHTLQNILKLNPNFKDKVALVYYRDKAEGREPLSDVLLRRIKNEIAEEEMQERLTNMAMGDNQGMAENVGTSRAAVPMEIENQDPEKQTFERKEGTGYHGLYDGSLVPAIRMSRTPRGKAIIISNRRFTGTEDRPAMSDRPGTEHDEKTLKDLWEDLGFEVDLYTNQTMTKMETIIQRAAEMDHSNYDCFVCCILTHGQLGVVYGSDSLAVEITGLTAFFQTCPSLFDKPKVFFIQACQLTPEQSNSPLPAIDGGDSTDGAQSTVVLSTDAVPQYVPQYLQYSSTLVPGARGFLMAYSTLPGHYSYRLNDAGTLYVQSLDENLRKYKNEMDIERILKLVSKEVNKKLCHIDPRLAGTQFPFHLLTMEHVLYFS